MIDFGGSGPITGDDPTTLRTLAQQCRRLARGASTAAVAASLKEIAAGYDNRAAREAARQEPGRVAAPD